MVAHPDVLKVAAIGVASDVREQGVAVLIVLAAGSSPDPVDLSRFVERNLPAFAVPRYIEFVDALPKTPAEKTAKGKVRERDVTDAAWAANAALGRR